MNAPPSRYFTLPLADRVWDMRYRWRDASGARDRTIEDTWHRVARALAAAEPHDTTAWARRFAAALADFRFLPGGRILAGAGTGRNVTLFNCFVMGTLDDSIAGIFRALRESALTMQRGGGIGLDFSTLRPRGAAADRTGGVASGPVSFMHVWNTMCTTLLATNARRGAMMATLACDHPDIEEFVAAKADRSALRHFNLSVLVSDAFMRALAEDADWPLAFPCAAAGGDAKPGGRVHRRVPARELWDRIMRANYDYAEPGVIFIDRVHAGNNLRYCERIRAANPCGEVPLPPYGACDLGSLNLTRFVRAPFSASAQLDTDALREAAAVAVRMLDNVYAISNFPLAQQRDRALRSRRVGLGITGLADALVMLGIRYGAPESLRIAREAMRTICHSAYHASIELARERSAFPAFAAGPYLASPFVAALPAELQAGIARHGIRNSHLTAIAPTGSTSLLAGNVSSGLEPVFAAEFERQVRDASGAPHREAAVDRAVADYRTLTGDAAALPPAFVTGAEVDPEDQIAMQAALQAHVDSAISKTVGVPARFEFDRFRRLFDTAYALGLKGCTTFRPNAVTGSVLEYAGEVDACCAMAPGEGALRSGRAACGR
jgi:ribonucleoside-diphosphate reductase alpha chain